MKMISKLYRFLDFVCFVFVIMDDNEILHKERLMWCGGNENNFIHVMG